MRRSALIILIALAAVSIIYVPLRCQSEPPPRIQMLQSNDTLPSSIQVRLIEEGWADRVGDQLGLWVSVERQKLVGIRSGRVEFMYPCSTALRGVGSREHSNQTPLGWHEIGERIGAGAAQGAIFVERKLTGKVWSPGEPTEKDYVLSRILWLKGLEPGLNQGKGVDSHDRFIYIHGTPAEDKIGTPASMGCIRLNNRDVVTLFDVVDSGTRVLITSW